MAKPPADATVRPRPNRLEVSSAAIRHNLSALRRSAGSGVKIFVALKGNACGFGLLPAARLCGSAGADGLAVVDLADAVAVRDSGVTAPILVYAGNLIDGETIRAARQFDLTLTVHDPCSAQAIERHADVPIRIFVEVNVGGERFGLEPDAVLAAVARLRAAPHVVIAGIYTHMHVPSGAGMERQIAWEFARFQSVLSALHAAGTDIPIQMAASSKLLLATLKMNLSAIDPGHLVFGLDPGGTRNVDLGLHRALHAFKSALVQVNTLHRSAQLEDAPFKIIPGMKVGVIPIGWSDGFRTLHCGQVLVRGRRVPVLGAPSAEHARLDLTGLSDVAVGDEVVVIGQQGDSSIDLAEVQRFQAGIRESAITRGISRAIPRVYV
jgi:alanine racemase